MATTKKELESLGVTFAKGVPPETYDMLSHHAHEMRDANFLTMIATDRDMIDHHALLIGDWLRENEVGPKYIGWVYERARVWVGHPGSARLFEADLWGFKNADHAFDFKFRFT